MPSHLNFPDTFYSSHKTDHQMESIKFRIFAVLLFCACLGITNTTYAQASDNATLNVVLADVRSIKLNPAQSTVQLNFKTASDYQNGVVENQNAHLEVMSTGGFQVKVRSSGLSLVNGINTIPVSTISLVPSLSSGYVDMGASFQTVTLSPTQQQMISTPNGTTKIVFDVRYMASGGQPYIDKKAGTYVTTITFCIEPS